MTITALPGSLIECGRRGESGVLRVSFDPAPFLEKCGPGTAGLLVQRPDGCAYPAPLTEENGLLLWTVSAADTACEGSGLVQIDWRSGEKVARSQRYRTYVAPSVNEGEAPPEGTGWLDAVLDAQNRAEAAANAVPQLAETAKKEITCHAQAEKQGLSAHAQGLWQSVAEESEVDEMLNEAFRPAL